MSSNVSKQPVLMAGQVISLRVSKAGKVKGLTLKTAQSLIKLKLKKSLRKSATNKLKVGDWIHVRGVQTFNKGKKPNRIKVTNFSRLTEKKQVQASQQTAMTDGGSEAITPMRLPLKHPAKKAQICVCQKSSCCKKGAKKVFKAFEKSVKAHKLDHAITLKPTSCLGQCKLGPAVMVMPGKKKFKQVTPSQVERVIQSYQQVS